LSTFERQDIRDASENARVRNVRASEEALLNLAYRWFCRLGLEGKVPDNSAISKNR
jgi:hypothetical protein